MGGNIAVAIDGPSGAGKSTLSRLAAGELGFLYVDTGALYRAVALFALEQGLDPSDGEALVPRLPEAGLDLGYREGEQRVFLGSRDVSEEIRTPEVSMATSAASAIPGVRDYLLELQRDLAKKNNVIMDGRDIGTVVLPEARVKIFLTATPEARADRRWKEYLAKGRQVGYNEVLQDILQRDHNDSTRAAAPLRKAEGAVILDTSELDFEQSLRLIITTIKERGGL